VVRPVWFITDCFCHRVGIPTSGRSTPSSTRSRRRCARRAYRPARREGAREGRWTLLDYRDIVVHIQHQDDRNFYALDRLWSDCPVVPVDLDSDGSDPSDSAGGANEGCVGW